MARKGENIRQRSDKRWEARFISGRSADGRAIYKSVYGKTYNEVKQKRILAILEILNGEIPEKISSDRRKNDISDTKFHFLCEQWLEIKRSSGVKESTYNKYYNICHKYLIPALGEIKCSDMAREMLEMKRVFIDKVTFGKTADAVGAL